jgi:hypothetical protein
VTAEEVPCARIDAMITVSGKTDTTILLAAA